MTDFNKILDKAKELESKMKESQEKIKNISVTGISGGDSVKITLNGEGEIINFKYYHASSNQTFCLSETLEFTNNMIIGIIGKAASSAIQHQVTIFIS